jgi:membrane protein YdbS with pleckstrin-like domain
MDEFDFLNRRTAENRRINDTRAAFRMIGELLALIIAAAVLVILAYIGKIPDWWTIALVLAGTGCVFFRLGRFVGGV